jgi:hypothetical protein
VDNIISEFGADVGDDREAPLKGPPKKMENTKPKDRSKTDSLLSLQKRVARTHVDASAMAELMAELGTGLDDANAEEKPNLQAVPKIHRPQMATSAESRSKSKSLKSLKRRVRNSTTEVSL